ncbi:hypothetical protein V8E53_003600 [Lactarius tabidus]
MPPKSTRSRKRSGAGAPPAPPAPILPTQSAAQLPPGAEDTLFGFLAKVPSPVSLPSSHMPRAPAAGSGAPSPIAQAAAAPKPMPRDNPYAFLEKVPSLVTMPPLQRGQGSTTATGAITTHSSAAASRDNPYAFLEKVPSPVTMPPLQRSQGSTTATGAVSTHSGAAASPVLRVQNQTAPPGSSFGGIPTSDLRSVQTPSGNTLVFNEGTTEAPQSPPTDEIESFTASDPPSPSPSHESDVIMGLSAQGSVIGLPEGGDAAERDTHARNAQLLVHRLSRTPPINQISSSRIPVMLEERLNAARDIIDNQLEEMADFRRDLNRLNDRALQHVIGLYNVYLIYPPLTVCCSENMPPKTTTFRMCSGGHTPAAHCPPTKTAGLPTDTVVPTAHPTQEAALPSSSAASCNNCFAFMAIVPSRVRIPPSPQGEGSTTVTRSATTAPVTTPALPSLSQLATLPSHMAAEDSTISFMANVPSPVTLPPTLSIDTASIFNKPQDDIDRITVSDSSPPDSDDQEISPPEDVFAFLESGIAAAYSQRSQTVAALAGHLSRAPLVSHIDSRCPALLTLEERLHEAQDVIHQALEDLETFSIEGFLYS